MLHPRFVLAVDPGKVTGLAWYAVEQRAMWTTERPLLDALALCEDWLEEWGPATVVVGEAYDPRSKVDHGRYWSIRGLGTLEYLAAKHGAEYATEQKPGDAKRTMTVQRLIHLGWRNPTPGSHADDAARHAGHLLVGRHLLTYRDLGPA